MEVKPHMKICKNITLYMVNKILVKIKYIYIILQYYMSSAPTGPPANRINNYINTSLTHIGNITSSWNGWIVIVVAMIILLIAIITTVASQTETSGNSGHYTTTSSFVLGFGIFCLVVFLGIILYTFKSYISQLSNVIILFIYIYALILIFNNVSKDTLDKYAYIILPITLLFGFFMFYRILSEKVQHTANIIFERIKFIITFILLIVFLILFYSVNLGGYVTKYFGVSMVLTILLAVFGILYLLTVMLFPALNVQAIVGSAVTGGQATSSHTITSFFAGFSLMSIVSVIFFIIFLTTVTILLVNWPGVAVNEFPGPKIVVIICAILICILWLSSFAINLTTGIQPIDAAEVNTDFSTIGDIFRRILLLLFGIIFSCILIVWLVTNLQSWSNQSSVGSFILNLIIVIIMLAILYKIITLGDLYKESHIFKLIINIVLYIPCLLVNIVDIVVDLFGLAKSSMPNASPLPNVSKLSRSIYNRAKQQYAIETQSSNYVLLLGFIILVYIVYFTAPYIITLFCQQGGKLLINSPTNLNVAQNIGTYQSLNWSKTLKEYTNQYGISFWVFIDAASPNTINGSYRKYTSILDYGNKPNILYNASKNTLIVTIKNVGQKTTGSINSNPIPPEYDDNGDIIVYKNSNVLLQKWNNIIINYNSGILDIFYNGDLVKTVMEVTPYMKLDTLTIGSNQGINGGICNVNYFNTSLSIRQIYYLYNLVKDKTPPITINTDVINTAIREIDVSLIDEIDHVASSATAIIAPATKTVVKDISNNVIANLVPPNLNVTGPNYLSMQWYFSKNNKDIYNT